MSEKEEISRLKREIELLEEERDSLLETAEDAHTAARVAEEINAMDREEEIIDTILETVCIIKDVPYASFLRKRKEGFKVEREYVNSEVRSKVGEEFREADLPTLKGLKKRLYLTKPTMPLETLLFLPRPPKGKQIHFYALLPIFVMEELYGVLLACTFDEGTGFSERTIPLLERLSKTAVRRIETLRLMRTVEELNEKLRERLGEKTRRLAESEERYRTLVEESQDAIVIVDESGGIVVFNRAAERMLGYTREEALGRRPEELYIPEEHLPRHGKGLERMRKSGEGRLRGRTIEAQARRKNGENFPIEISFFTFTTSQGRFTGSIIRDITKRKAAEEALRESEERYRSLVDTSPDMIAIHDEERILYINPAGAEMLGAKSPDEVIGKGILDFVHPDHREELVALMHRIPYDEAHSDFVEGRFVRRDGSVIDYEIFASPTTYKGKRARQIVLRNITPRKEAEEEIRRSREEWERIFTSISDSVMILDLEHRILAVNPAAMRLTGLSEKELLGRRCYEIFHCTDHPPEGCPHERLVKSRHPETVDMEMEALHGTFLVTVAPILDAQGRMVKTLHIAKDITERKRAEEALRESEERYRRLSDASLEGIAIHEKGKILDANQTFADMFGYELNEVIGMNALDLAAPKSRELVMEKILSGYEKPYEAIGLRKDGTTFIGEISPKKVRYKGRDVRLAAIRDITERKRAEEEIRRLKDFSENVINEAPVLIAVFDRDFRVRVWNSFSERYTQVPKEKILGRNLFEVIPSLKKLGWEEVFRKVIETGEPYSVEDYEITRTFGPHKGEKWYQNITLKPLIEDGEVTGLIETIVDVTDRKHAEEALRESEERYRTLIEASEDYVFALDTEGTFIFANQKAIDTFGDLIGQPFTVPVPEEYHDVVRKNFARRMKGEAVEPYEIEVLDKKGRRRWVEISGAPLVREGKLVGAVYFQKDITERKRAEEELERHRLHLEELVRERTRELEEANRRLQEADRLKSVFLASMSHELRTPLNSIIGFTGILLQGMAGELNPEQRKQLDIVYSSAKHLLALINDLLDISKIEMGEVEFSSEEFRLGEAVDEVVKTFLPEIERKGLRLEKRVSDGVIQSDRRRFKQVLMNLLGNAVKFTRKGRIAVEAAVEKDRVTVTVKDTGVGIKKKDLPRLFQPFQQLEIPEGMARDGTGLGLYLSKKIVTLLGGEIKAESTYRRGSAFTFSLPSLYMKSGGKD
ncbi:MAG: PAS domain S-box protein [Methanobacteriota archaeon]|nr:MAG: PAS domain S-box protein [Euryarchaeota archaeon]